MERARLNWVIQFSVLVLLVACGSSRGPGASGGTFSANVGGQDPSLVGGSSSVSNGGNSAASTTGYGGNGGDAGSGTAGNGAAGSASQGGDVGTGATGSAVGGGSALGGAGDGGATSDAVGGASSQDVITGGSTSQDVATGGSTSQDVATGGGDTLDRNTGGDTSVDIATGGDTSVDVATGGDTSVDIVTGGTTSVDRATGGTGGIELGCTETTLTDINVYVIKDATPNGADAEGNMYVGGNLGGSSYSIGAKDAAANCSKEPPFYSLVVGGNINVSGSLVVKGGWGAYVGTASTGATGFECGLRHAKVVDFPTLEAQVKALSTRMTTLAANGIDSEDASGALILTGTDKDLNVFNIDASQLGAVTINVPLTSSVVVNVSGKIISWPGAKMTLPGPTRTGDDYEFSTHVVWNLYEATSFTIGGIALQGSILAPYATIEADSGGHVAGQVIVEYLKGNTEYHPYYFSGCITWQNL